MPTLQVSDVQCGTDILAFRKYNLHAVRTHQGTASIIPSSLAPTQAGTTRVPYCEGIK